VNERTERLQCLEQALLEQVTTWRPPPVVEALQALRRTQLTVAVTIIGELGVLTPFDNSSQLMSYFGLTFSESSSGERRRQGPTTKTENTPARHALVEGAWAYRYPVQVSRHLQRRREKLPKAAQDISGKAHVRRGKRDRKLSTRGKHVHQVVVAIARELITLIRAIAEEVPVPLACPDRPAVEQQSIPSEAARPRYVVTLNGVTRPAGKFAPRWRQAPDGLKSGNRQPMDSSRINRRVLLAPPFPMANVKD
jgi:transposase